MNPPYSKNVSTEFGSRFLNLINKHYSSHSHTYFTSCSKIKVSCSCMPKMKNKINIHNKNIICPPKYIYCKNMKLYKKNTNDHLTQNVSPLLSDTIQVLHQTKKIQKQNSRAFNVRYGSYKIHIQYHKTPN